MLTLVDPRVCFWAECTHALILVDTTRMGSYSGRVRQNVGWSAVAIRSVTCLMKAKGRGR